MIKKFLLILVIPFIYPQYVSEEVLAKKVSDGVLFVEQKGKNYRLWTIHDLLKEWYHLPMHVRKLIMQYNPDLIQPEKKVRWSNELLLQYESDESY